MFREKKTVQCLSERRQRALRQHFQHASRRRSLAAYLSALEWARYFFQPGASHGAEAAIKNVLRVTAIKQDTSFSLCAHQSKGLIGGTAVIKHQRHIGDWCGKPNGTLRPRKSFIQLSQRYAVTALFLASFDSQYRELHRAQADKQQYDKIAGGLQSLDDVSFGFDAAVGELLPVGEYGFERKGHLAFHDKTYESLNARLRKQLPTGVVVAKLLGPGGQLSGLFIGRWQDRSGDAIGIDQGYLQLSCEAFVPQGGFAAAVVPGENEGRGFLLSGDRLRKKFG
jgi:hypothetical protein